MTSSTPALNLWTLLHDSRSIHEQMLRKSLGHRETAGTCAFAAYFLDFSIKRWLPHLKSQVQGGDGLKDGGFFDATGKGHGHYWVAIEDGDEHWVADITADQFGCEPIRLLRQADAKAYVPGNAELVEEQMEVFGEWLAESGAAELGE